MFFESSICSFLRFFVTVSSVFCFNAGFSAEPEAGTTPKVTLPPVKTECVQLIYFTKEGKRYGLWCDLSSYTMESSYGNCFRSVKVECGSDEFLRDTATTGWILKKGFHCPKDQKWLQVRDLWAFVGWYDLCPFYSGDLKRFINIVRVARQSGYGFGLMDFPMIAEDVLARIGSGFRVMQWSMVGDADLQHALATDKRTHNEVFLRSSSVVFRGVQKGLLCSLARLWDEDSLSRDSALRHLFAAFSKEACGYTEKKPLKLNRYSGDDVAKVYVT